MRYVPTTGKLTVNSLMVIAMTMTVMMTKMMMMRKMMIIVMVVAMNVPTTGKFTTKSFNSNKLLLYQCLWPIYITSASQVIVMECKNLKKMDVGGLSGAIVKIAIITIATMIIMNVKFSLSSSS